MSEVATIVSPSGRVSSRVRVGSRVSVSTRNREIIYNNNNGIFNREECWVSFFEGINAKADAKANESKTKQKEHFFGGASGSEGDFHAGTLVDDDGR